MSGPNLPPDLSQELRLRAERLFSRYPPDVIEMGRKIWRQKQIENREVDITRMTERARALESFDYFMKRYFSRYFTEEDGPAQKELTDVVESFKNKSKRSPLKKARAMPRGYGKSVRMSLGAPLWLCLRGDWHFVVMISSTLESAKRLLNSVIQECEDNQRLIDDFPELAPQRDNKGQLVSWTDSDIAFRGGFRMIAKGFLNAVRGARHKQHRPSALVIDDPDEERDVASESKMKRKYSWLDRAALRLGSNWGVDVLMAYTTIAANCVGEYVYSQGKYASWDRKKWKAIEVDENGQEYSTWPAGYTIEALRLIRDGDGTEENPGDAIMFAQEFQNDPLAEGDQKFKGKIQVWDYDANMDWNGWRLALAVDPSLGKNEKSDFSAIIGLGLSPEGRYYEVYSDIARRLPDKIMEDYLVALTLLPWTITGADTTANQVYFLNNFRERVAAYNRELPPDGKKILCPIHDIQCSGDKDTRIESALQMHIATGQLRIRSDSAMLFGQLNEFPYRKKDGPDALEMAKRLLDTYPVIVTRKAPQAATKVGQVGKRLSNDRLQNIMKRSRRD